MRILAIVLLALGVAGCSRQMLATNTWYDSAEIVCQRPHCPHCHGTLGVTCAPCKGSGGLKCTSCKDGTTTCGTCKGDGVKKGEKCKSCEGSGKTKCYTCDGDRIMDCSRCAAKGKVCCLQRITINEPGVQRDDEAWPRGSYEVKK